MTTATIATIATPAAHAASGSAHEDDRFHVV